MTLESGANRSRVAVLTAGGEYAEQILVGLALRGVPVEALLISQMHPRHPAALVRRIRKRLRQTTLKEFLRLAVSQGLQRVALRLTQRAGGGRPWVGLARNVIMTGPLNGREMVEAVQQVAPDYLVLAGVGIVKDQVLSIPKQGTINVHPAILPFCRGVGVVARSLQRRVPIGITAHYVNAGIDTGEVIRRELVPAGEVETVRSLKRKAAVRSAELMVELIAAMSTAGRFPGTPQPLQYAYCRRPGREEEQEISAHAENGLAMQLYDKWHAFYGGNVLPASVEPHPEIDLVPAIAKRAAA